MGLQGSTPFVDAVGVACTYGRGARAVAALVRLDLRIEPGEVVGLLGRNGSGKSTTLRCILGFEPLRAGTLRVFGGPPGHRAARARTGFVPEEARRFGRLTGRETVDLFARLQGVGPRVERRRRVEASLEEVGLERAAWDRRAGGYSRGMARRLAMAAASVSQPDLLVLDEPTSGLDPFGTADLHAAIANQRRAGRSAVFATHDRVAAEEACDRLVVLDRGTSHDLGPPALALAGDDSPSLRGLLERVARA